MSRWRISSSFLFLAVCIALGAAIRLDFLVADHFRIDSDEAIVGLMARHINQGASVPVFYYGQSYMGSFEPIVVSLAFKLFGESSVVLKLVPFFFSLVLIPLTYLLGRIVASEWAARTAALLMALPPSPLVIWSSMARGGFIEVIFLGVVSLILLFAWMRGRENDLIRLFILSVVLGFGWWTNNQILYFMFPTALGVSGVILWKNNSGFLSKVCELAYSALVGVIGFLLGGAPYWIYNIANNFPSAGMFKPVSFSEFEKHLDGVFNHSLPILLGARRFWGEEESYPFSVYIAVTLFSIVLVLLFVSRFKSVVKGFALKWDNASPLELLASVIIFAIPVFALSSFGFLVEAPRYLLPLYPPLFVLIGVGLAKLWRWNPAISFLSCIGILASNIASSYAGGRAVPGMPFVYSGERVSKDNTELVSWLSKHNIRFVRTNYWIGYRLAFETGEATRFLMFKEPHQVRINDYEIEGKELPESEVPYILTKYQAELVREAFQVLKYQFQEDTASGYVIFYNVKRPEQSGRMLPASLITARASSHQDLVANALDGDNTTRWGSGMPQSQGMWFKMDFRNPVALTGLKIDWSNWAQDYPRGLSVVVRDTNNRLYEIISRQQSRAVFYALGDSELELAFPPIPAEAVILHQDGEHPVFDWSIGEITLFGK